MEYVTYNAAGDLTGAYLQDLLQEHKAWHIPVTTEVRLNWLAYRANGARDGVEKAVVDVPAPTVDDLAAAYEFAVQARLDQVAQSYGYDNMATAVTYAEEPAVPRFQAEGRALRAWRSQVWETCYRMLAQVMSGTIAIPTEADVMAALPEAPLQEAYT